MQSGTKQAAILHATLFVLWEARLVSLVLGIHTPGAPLDCLITTFTTGEIGLVD